MSGAIAAIEAIRLPIVAPTALSPATLSPAATLPTGLPGAATVKSVSFADMLQQGIATTNTKLLDADRMVTAFALDGSMPAHKVTFALEEARLSLELMIQVRNRMIDGFQQIMNMQV
jgi:flagellar hook-basal body complex protein FliE